MKTFFTLLISFFYLSPAAGQEPIMLSLNVIGGNGTDEVLTPVTKTSDGGFIISYQTSSTSGPINSLCSTPDPEVIFQKYNADASIVEWSKCYAAEGDTFLEFMYPQNDEGAVFGGQYMSSYDWGFYICKQDVLGNIVWSHGYSKGNGPLLFDMINTDDGGYIMFGEAYHIDTNTTIHYGDEFSADFWVLKLDSLGNKVWSKVIGGTGEEAAHKVISAPGNGCYITGFTSSNDYDCTGNHGGSNDVYLARLDVNGNIMWHKDLGGTNNDGGKYGWPDGDGGIIIGAITGSHDGDVNNHIGSDICIWALEVDSSGNILWNNCYGNGGNEDINAICKATDGGIWIAGVSGTKGGEIDNAYGGNDAWFVHADSVGNFINAKVLGSSTDDRGEMIYPLSNSNVIAGGFYSKNDGAFSSLESYGPSFSSFDAFLGVFAPRTTGFEQMSKMNNKVTIYPNPTNEYVTIEALQNENNEVVITDLIGREVYKVNLIDKVQVSVKNWNKGMYFIQVTCQNGFKDVQKIIVE